jgi:phosphoglycerate dehydrogenase-like enzyme
VIESGFPLHRIAVGPDTAPEWVAAAVRAGGGEVVGISAAGALVWSDPADRDGLASVLAGRDDIDWVQVPFAGVENFIDLVDGSRLWTCGKGVYAEPVAEHALALALAGMRHVAAYARQTRWSGPAGRNLLGARVVVLGGGGICRSLLRLLEPFGCDTTVVRNGTEEVPGASRTVGPDGLHDALASADLVVLALALTPSTVGILGRAEFEIMQEHAWVVNVARGRHIVTDDLVAALRSERIGGAALDVTDPEPLPADHPLWSTPRCIVTPHVGNTPEMAVPLLSARITDNVARRIAGLPLVGVIDPGAGY